MGDYAQHQQSNHQLKILLATLDMTDFGAKSIFNILKYRGKVLKLKTLSCSYNQFTDAGINLLDQIMELVDNQITIYTFGNVNETPHVYTDSELEELKLKYMVEK